MITQQIHRAVSTTVNSSKAHARALVTKEPNIVYRLANKKDKEALTDLMAMYISNRPYQGTLRDTEERCSYMVRDALRFPYTMMAYDNDLPVGFSLITNRFRDVSKNRLELLGPIPRTTTDVLDNLRDHAENHLWCLVPEAQNIFINEALFIEPNYRRQQIASTLVEEQFRRICLLTKNEWSMNGMIAPVTSYAHFCLLEKLGFVCIYDIPPQSFLTANGEEWKSADTTVPFARLMLLKY
ncbi:unnamed protein product [Auanema sp. JU1783]|nr:unnamed protein product [Auanema sp. JU1783]